MNQDKEKRIIDILKKRMCSTTELSVLTKINYYKLNEIIQKMEKKKQVKRVIDGKVIKWQVMTQ